MSENSSAFKNLINQNLLRRMAEALKTADPRLETKALLKASPRLEPLELKARVQLVREALKEILPEDFQKAVSLLLLSLQSEKLSGFDLWPYTDFVQTYGLDHFDISMAALKELTSRFTSEFAIRPFLLKEPKKTLAWLKTQINDPNPHVRRWVSEGTRPRLPWGERLAIFIKDPRPGLELLEELRFDEELYVRKSVANHLNDISKDHPELLIRTLSRWAKETPPDHRHHEKTRWLIRHATRTLIKKGHPGALKLAGVKTGAMVRIEKLKTSKPSYRLGEILEFDFQMTSTGKAKQKLIVDYVMHFQKANGKTAPKVFKLKTMTIPPGASVHITKKHGLKQITTRRYYKGLQHLEVQINGRIMAKCDWTLR